MNRRDLIGWLSGFTASAALAPLSAEDRLRIAEELHDRSPSPTGTFSERQATLVALLADTILPPTDTPGAVEVGVPQFIAKLTADWYSENEAQDLRAGLDAIEARSRERFGRGFVEATAADRTRLLTELDGKEGKPGSAEHAFGRIKSLTVYGYFTSKRIQTEVLKTVIMPGRFEGCIPVPAR